MNIIIFIITIVLFIAFIGWLIKMENERPQKIREQEEKRMASEGKYRYDVPIGYCFSIYKEVDGGKYYLHNDMNFYSDGSYAYGRQFPTEEERNDYIKQYDEKMKLKHGKDIKYNYYKIMRCTDYCKKL